MPEIGKLWDKEQSERIAAMERIADDLDDPDELYVVDAGAAWQTAYVDVDMNDGDAGSTVNGEFLVTWELLEEAEAFRDRAYPDRPVAAVEYDDCMDTARELGIDGIAIMLHFVPRAVRWVR